MDLAQPLKTVTPTLDAAVLQVLTATTGWTTGGQVHRRGATGSPDGVRRVLGRLVQQGIVLAEPHPHATLYLFNRDHVCAPAIAAMVRVRAEIVERIMGALGRWGEAPVHASLFGSFARGEAGEDSDIDMLVVRADAPVVDPDGVEQSRWEEQLERLTANVQSWTGNQAHLVDITVADLARMVAGQDPLVTSWRVDHVDLVGVRMLNLLRRAS